MVPMRQTKAVADLIPGDVILPGGHVVNPGEVAGYPHGVSGLPGSIISIDEGHGIIVNRHYFDPETPIEIV